MHQKENGDTYVAWIDPKILTIIFIFAREGGLQNTFLKVGHSSNYGILILVEDKKNCNKYNGCTIHFHESTFLISGFQFPFMISKLKF